MPLDSQKIQTWLDNSLTESADGQYRHRLLRECQGRRPEILEDLKRYFHTAFDDARRLLRHGFETLNPLEEPPSFDPAENYPRGFPMNTLRGYFGEVFAAIVAEHFEPMGEGAWKVPALLFRFHQA